ncbi:MAG TPA: hypothetical protein VLD57_11045 [Blastocatellia bacterium]|nr:hypothetical protein [Blastocatellia bacterium]
MKITLFKRSLIVFAGSALILAASALNTPGQSGESAHPRITLRPVVQFMGGAVIPSSGSALFRHRDGVFFTLSTSELTPGDAVTAWLAVFNNPEFCATSPCSPADFANPAVDGTLFSTGGVVVGPDGKATYGAYRAVGDLTGARPNFGTGNGLLKPTSAEIHVAIRTHGPANLMDPAVLQEQLTQFNGGCPPGSCATIQASIHQR